MGQRYGKYSCCRHEETECFSQEMYEKDTESFLAKPKIILNEELYRQTNTIPLSVKIRTRTCPAERQQ